MYNELPDRIDFLLQPPVMVVFFYRLTGGTYMQIDRHDHAQKIFSDVLPWLTSHGYSVRTWPGGARAWLGKPRPIRTRAQIVQLRRQLQSQADAEGNHPRFGTSVNSLELALDV